MNLYQFSQRATAIYQKAMRDDKRLLINLIFSELILRNDKITATYSKAFQILSELVELTNKLKSSKVEKDDRIVARNFELPKKVDFTIQTDAFYYQRPVLLPKPRIIINELQFGTILQTFQNLSFIGELRQRWQEIKKLQVNPLAII